VGEVKFGSDGERSSGGELGGDMAEEGGERGCGFHCAFCVERFWLCGVCEWIVKLGIVETIYRD